jgi:hypothetical protein
MQVDSNKAMAARASKNLRHNIARSTTPEVGESRRYCGATNAGLYFKMQLSEFCHPTSAQHKVIAQRQNVNISRSNFFALRIINNV